MRLTNEQIRASAAWWANEIVRDEADRENFINILSSKMDYDLSEKDSVFITVDRGYVDSTLIEAINEAGLKNTGLPQKAMMALHLGYTTAGGLSRQEVIFGELPKRKNFPHEQLEHAAAWWAERLVLGNTQNSNTLFQANANEHRSEEIRKKFQKNLLEILEEEAKTTRSGVWVLSSSESEYSSLTKALKNSQLTNIATLPPIQGIMTIHSNGKIEVDLNLDGKVEIIRNEDNYKSNTNRS